MLNFFSTFLYISKEFHFVNYSRKKKYLETPDFLVNFEIINYGKKEKFLRSTLKN